MDATKYNLKEAFDKKLTGKARLHYLENYEHDMYTRKGYSGEYTGNHPKYSRGVSMMGNPTNPIKAMDDDLKFMPVEDIAGQGTEGVNMKMNPIKMGHDSPAKEGKYGGNKGDLSRSRRDFEGPSMMKTPVKMGHKSPTKMGHKSPTKMGHKSPVKALQFGRKN